MTIKQYSPDHLTVCHISSMHPVDDDRIFQRACFGLTKIGCKVTYLVTNPKSETILGVDIVALTPRIGWKRRLFSSYEAYRKGRKIPADIYHFHDPDLLPWMFLLAIQGKPVVYDIHENYLDRFTRFPLTKVTSKIFKLVENFIVKRLAGAITVSDSLAKYYLPVAKRHCIVRNVVSLARLQMVNLDVPKSPVPLIYTSGIINDRRNCRQSIEAMPYLLKRVPNAQLMFAGFFDPDDYAETLMNLAKKLGVADHLILGEPMPWLENFQRTIRAHIGLVVMEDTLNARVALSNRVFEYMYCKIPVVADDQPEFRKLIEETECGILTNSCDPERYANDIANLIENPQLAAKLGANGNKAITTKYNMEHELENMMEFYRQILTDAGKK